MLEIFYTEQEDYEKAKKCNEKILKLCAKTKEKLGFYEIMARIRLAEKEIARKEFMNAYNNLSQLRKEVTEGTPAMKIVTAMIDADIGIIQLAMNRMQEGLKYMKAATLIMEETLDENNGHIPGVYIYLSVAYMGVFNFEDAFKYCKKAKNIYKKVKHPKLFRTYFILAVICQGLKRFEKAIQYCNETIKIVKSLKAMETEVADLYCFYMHFNLGGIYTNLYNTGKAIEHFEESLRIYERCKDKSFPYLSMVYANLASMYNASGRQEEAKKYSNLLMEVVNKNKKFNLNELYDKIRTLYSLKKFSEIIQVYTKISNKLESYCYDNPSEGILLAKIYNAVAETYFVFGDKVAEEIYLLKAITHHEKLFGSNGPDIAACYFNMGRMNYEIGKYELAIEWIDKALRAREGIYWQDYFLMGQIFTIKGRALYKLKKYNNAHNAVSEALNNLIQVSNRDDLLIKELSNELKDIDANLVNN